MKDVAETHHLQKRGTTWHYYRRVPTALVPLIGKTFIKQSLGTKDLKAAKVLRNALNVKIDAEFAAAENSEDQVTHKTRPVSLAELTEYLRKHIEALDGRSAVRLLTNPPEDEDQKSSMVADVELGLQILKNRDDPRGEEWIDGTGEKVLASSDAALNDDGVISSFAEIVRRGLIELQNRKLDRLVDHYDVGHHDPLFDPNRASTVTFGELADVFWAERTAEYAANGVTEKRSDKVRAELDFVIEALGEDTPLHCIDDDAIQAFRKMLDRTPANRKKLYPKLTLAKAKNGLRRKASRCYHPPRKRSIFVPCGTCWPWGCARG